MKLFIEYNFPNWNKYIDLERGNYHAANKLKQMQTAVRNEIIEKVTFVFIDWNASLHRVQIKCPAKSDNK